jgi:hypothetical protein
MKLTHCRILEVRERDSCPLAIGYKHISVIRFYDESKSVLLIRLCQRFSYRSLKGLKRQYSRHSPSISRPCHAIQLLGAQGAALSS